MKLFCENDYERQMWELAEPYLSQRGQKRYLRRGKGKIYCETYRADAPRGIIVISHGFTENVKKYEELICYFLQMGYHVYIMEHCGHGKSYRLSEDLSLVHVDSYKRYLQDYLHTVRMASREYPGLPVIAFGHSMGGGIAAAAAARCPDLFDGVILSSPMIRPLTGGVPWHTAKRIARAACIAGKKKSYVAGQRPYEEERFEDSAGTSEARFKYYQAFRSREPLYQMNAASYGWLSEAALLNRELMKKSWRKLDMPVLLFQAGQDSFVSNRAQNIFVKKLRRGGICPVSVRRFENAKHEIYLSEDNVLALYVRMIAGWLNKNF